MNHINDTPTSMEMKMSEMQKAVGDALTPLIGGPVPAANENDTGDAA